MPLLVELPVWFMELDLKYSKYRVPGSSDPGTASKEFFYIGATLNYDGILFIFRGDPKISLC